MSNRERHLRIINPQDTENEDNPVVVDLHKKRLEQAKDSKKNLRRNIAQVGLITVGVGLTAFAVWANRSETFDDPTKEQESAQRYLTALEDTQKVENLVVGKDGVNLRDKPNSGGSEGFGREGEIEDFLKPGTVIDMAGVVMGNNPNIPFAVAEKDKWFFFENPQKEGEIVFANSNQFEPSLQAHVAEVVELEK